MSNANASGGGAIADKDEYARRRDRRSIQVYLSVATLANNAVGDKASLGSLLIPVSKI